jgi:predicted DNA-binding transcriptional regulator AlpA
MRMIGPQELGPLKGINFGNVWRLELERLGRFPKRVKLGARRYAYIEAEIDDWIRACAASRQQDAA